MSNEMIIKPNMTNEEKVNLFNVLTNADTKLSDTVNTVISCENVLFTTGSTTNTETGEVEERERVIVIDTDGQSYHSMSAGLVGSFKNLCLVFGDPKEWATPIDVKVVKKETKKGQTYILEIVKA